MTTVRERYDITATPEKLITQWVDAPRLRAFINEITLMFDELLMQPLEYLEQQADINSASGYWLNAFGNRFGLNRPLVTSSSITQFGFRGDDDAGTFDQASFATLESFLVPTEGIGDEVYRALLKMQARSLIMKMTLPFMQQAIREIAPEATLEDTGNHIVNLDLAGVDNTVENAIGTDEVKLPKPAGIAINISNTLAIVLTTPSNIVLTIGDSRISLNWDDVADAVTYITQWKSGTEDYDASRQMTTATSEATILSLVNGTAYSFRIQAAAPNFTSSPFSTEITAIPGSIARYGIARYGTARYL